MDLVSVKKINTLKSIKILGFCFGGDEENRTPVQKPFHINFSEYSLLLIFLYLKLTNKLINKVVSKIPTICETTNSFVSH